MGFLSGLIGVLESACDGGCDWYCDSCGAYMNGQPGFSVSSGSWTCTSCGSRNDVSAGNVLDDSPGQGYVHEKHYDDGTVEKIRFTKTREVHDFDGPLGRGSIWRKRR